MVYLLKLISPGAVKLPRIRIEENRLTNRFRRVSRITWFSARATGYLLAMAALMFYLDASLRPPGFTGHSLLVLVLIPFASYHLANDCNLKVFFFVFGCLAAMPILLIVFTDVLVFSWSDIGTAWRYIAVSILFLLAMGFVSLFGASRCWKQGSLSSGFEVIPKESTWHEMGMQSDMKRGRESTSESDTSAAPYESPHP